MNGTQMNPAFWTQTASGAAAATLRLAAERAEHPP